MITTPTSLDIVYASDFEEFYYKDTDEAVPEGEPVALDVETPEGMNLVLFCDVYWNPQYEPIDE